MTLRFSLTIETPEQKKLVFKTNSDRDVAAFPSRIFTFKGCWNKFIFNQWTSEISGRTGIALAEILSDYRKEAPPPSLSTTGARCLFSKKYIITYFLLSIHTLFLFSLFAVRFILFLPVDTMV